MIRIAGTTLGDRHTIINAVSRAVDDMGGAVLELHQLPNQAVNYVIQLPAVGYGQLRDHLEEIGITLHPPFPEEIALVLTPFREDVPGSLRIDFGYAEPELDSPIPAAYG